LIIFCYYPAFSAFILAFTDYKPGVYMRFIGIQNFVSMFQNDYFWSGLGNAGIFLVTDLVKALVPPIFIAELILALRSKKLQYGVRVAMYIPGILPGVAGILVWVTGIFGMNGAINSIIQLFVPSFAQAWLADPNTALLSLILIGFPWVGSYLIFYGALMSIPASLFESAKLDGCTFFKRVRHIDIPLIRPQIKYIFVTSFIASLQNFSLIYLTTKGGPGHATYTPSLEMYMNMSQFQNYGEAAAMGLFLFVIIFGATLVNMRMRTSSES
jgi:raffinose/stachyose/melibiose transport system permease protein